MANKQKETAEKAEEQNAAKAVVSPMGEQAAAPQSKPEAEDIGNGIKRVRH